VQTLLKEVQREDLMLAMKTASEELRGKIFANISSRAGEILKEDMAVMGPVKLKDVERAQANIVAELRRLETEGKLSLGRGAGDVIV
jgi:flagellar motor switch protein FliG